MIPLLVAVVYGGSGRVAAADATVAADADDADWTACVGLDGGEAGGRGGEDCIGRAGRCGG